MPLPMGRWKSLSGMRRLVRDFCLAGQSVPTVMIERRMHLNDVVKARQLVQPRTQWTAIFIKAYALTSLEVPSLLRSYIRLPWPHLYEHQVPIASFTVERQYKNEDVALGSRLRHPHLLPLTKIDEYLRRCKNEPIESIREFRQIVRLSRLPGWISRMVAWYGLHASGRWRERYFGTYGVTSVASLGAGAIGVISPFTGTLHYGIFDEENRLDVRLTFDHRVLDGATAARALAVMENHLQGSILNELRSMKSTQLAA
ncbi:MAG: 2-oxo acid dehydrogenase subunit E2 [Planctomycetes bacterium]|nr:2-oxo acid dehydrogenase subunit E2 [Planctomycetota bacterium]